ncbi:MAG TPA: hypothetical protein VFN68_07035 [Acidimicrobiales bacterium]|nr:hypothetical protein [Acidimicrobiales bacterium]
MAGRHRKRRNRNLSFATRHQRRVPVRLIAFVAGVIVLLAAVVAVRAVTSPVPRLVVARALPASVRFPGPPPAPVWPKSGEAAAEVEGLGTLGSSGPQTPVPIASVAKIMTAYVTLQDHPVKAGTNGFDVTVSAAEVADLQQRSRAGQLVVPVAAGEVLNEVQLLEGLLVASGNNVAPILADYDAGSQAAFVTRMNQAAQRLGMSRTTYADASGISAATRSTAGDQLRLAAAAMGDPTFARIVQMTAVTLPVAGKLVNFNRAVGTGGYVGVKTGSGPQAGGCLVFANRQSVDGRSFTILGVVLGQDPGYLSTPVLDAAARQAADTIVASVKASVRSVTVVPAGTTVATVTSRQGRRTRAVTTTGITAVGWGGLALPVSVSVTGVGHSLRAGVPVATVKVPSGSPDQVDATSSDAVPPVSFWWRVGHVL